MVVNLYRPGLANVSLGHVDDKTGCVRGFTVNMLRWVGRVGVGVGVGVARE